MSSKSICGRKEYWADFHNFHHCPCLTVLHLTIWDFVHEVNLTHEFFEIINKRNIVSDYENEMYLFLYNKFLIRQARLTLKLKTTL